MDSKIYISGILVVLLIGFANIASATTYYCNSCSDCESKINSSSAGDIVKLTVDVINQSGTCINWRNSNIEFDCQGHLVNGSSSGDGISIIGKSDNNTIKNCAITGFKNGISLSGSNNNTIINNTVSSNEEDGIVLWVSSKNTITNNTINSNKNYGINFLAYSNSNAISLNKVCFNANLDFYMYYSSGNHGDENTCDTPAGWNDQNITGCTYSCYPVITCPLKGDMGPCNGKVDDYELLRYIRRWVQGIVGDFEILTVIDNWAKS